MARVERIWIKRAARTPMDPVETATLEAGEGIAGNADRGGQRQITLLDAGRWADLEREAGESVDPALRRANLLVSGVSLEGSAGRVLRLGSCRVRIVGETNPCARMEEERQGLRALMESRWGGGAYGEILQGGTLRVGDLVAWDAGEGGA